MHCAESQVLLANWQQMMTQNFLQNTDWIRLKYVKIYTFSVSICYRVY